MYPANVQILLSQAPPGRKMVMMASRELTASRAHPPEHSTALVWNTHNVQHLQILLLLEEFRLFLGLDLILFPINELI